MSVDPIKFDDGKLFVLDQLLLPHQSNMIVVDSCLGVFNIIRKMNVRGAPLIGFTGIFGLSFAAREVNSFDHLAEKAQHLVSARPTAVNLSFEINDCLKHLRETFSYYESESVHLFCVEFARRKIKKLESDNTRAAKCLMEDLLRKLPGKSKYNILTICNTGKLACGTRGTALGAISLLNEHDLINRVYACETRPYLQGSRLTAYELKSEGIDYSIIPDGAVAHTLKTQKVDAIFVGADRVALNGDTANKIGTANISIIANYYEIPFYVVAPISSFDFECQNGDSIDIELRDDDELTMFDGKHISPKGSGTFNPGFDITESKFITAIVCEKGVFSPTLVKDLY